MATKAHDHLETGKLGLPLIAPLTAEQEFQANSLRDYEIRVFLEYSRQADTHPLARLTREKLSQDPRFAKIDGLMLNQGLGGRRIELELLVIWWLWRANMVGEEGANRELDEFLSSNEIEVTVAQWVYGVIPAGQIELPRGVELLSVEQMPGSTDRERFVRFPHRVETPIPIPSGALVLRCRIPKTSEPNRLPSRDDPAFAAVRVIEDISLLLNCLEDVCCLPAFTTSYTPAGVPLGPFAGRGGSSPVYDVIPHGRSELTQAAVTPVAELLNGFGKLSEKYRLTLSRAIWRLAQAKGRQHPSDKALDLGISLEMVLLNEAHRGAELPVQLHSHFRLRGSWLVGNTYEDRRELYDDLRDIYSLRSQVAHNGFSDKLEKMRHSDSQTQFGRHARVAERVFQKLIIDGFPSDWTEIILGKGDIVEP